MRLSSKIPPGRLCWICAAAGALLALSAIALFFGASPVVHANGALRVMAWSERSEPVEVYPHGINGAIAEMFAAEKDVQVRVVNLADPGQGLTEEALAATDVLVWFGHRQHKEVTEENVDRVVRHVHERGLGYLPLHSAHYARPFQRIMQRIAEQRGAPLEGTPGRWGRVRNEGRAELIHILKPEHPIARGVRDFTIPKTETYWNPFTVPAPDLKILEGRYEGDQQDGNDGLLWQYGKGKVFYFRPGHETYPILFQPEIRQILKNAVRFLANRT